LVTTVGPGLVNAVNVVVNAQQDRYPTARCFISMSSPACARRCAISCRCTASGRSSAPAISRSTSYGVKVGDKEVKLSPKEYDLLRVLVQHAGKVLTHGFLLGELWDDLTDARYLRVYVRQLRQKIETDPERPHYILTETGIGYRLRASD
jgi:DNA-binding response OmpR family regulator